MEQLKPEFKTKDYSRKMNDILRTNMKLTQSIMDEEFKEMQLYTILLNHQIDEIIEVVKEIKSKIYD